MSKVALNRALELIEHINKDGWILADFEPEIYATIAAIKKALAHPDQTWVGLELWEASALWASTDDRDSWELLKRVENKLREKNT